MVFRHYEKAHTVREPQCPVGSGSVATNGALNCVSVPRDDLGVEAVDEVVRAGSRLKEPDAGID